METERNGQPNNDSPENPGDIIEEGINPGDTIEAGESPTDSQIIEYEPENPGEYFEKGLK